MKTSNYYLIGGLLIIAGLVWYFYIRKPKPIPPAPPATTPAPSGGGGSGTTTGGTTGTTTGGGGAPNFVGVGMNVKISKAGYPVYFEDITDDWTVPAQPAFYTSSENLNALLGKVEMIKDFNEFYITPYPRKKFAKINYNNGERAEIWVELDAISQV